MIPTELQPVLEQIGLNHHESQVYLALLMHGRKPASSVARLSGAPRGTVRSILDKLTKLGLVDKIYHGNTQHYACLPPDALERFVEQDIAIRTRKLSLIRDAIPALKAMRNAEAVMPAVRYFEGEAGVIEALRHSLITEPKEILFVSSYDFFKNERVGSYDANEYLPSRIRRGIRMRVLSEQNVEAEYWDKRAAKELREHRFVAKGLKLPGNFFIYDRFVLYFAANQGEYIASLTESALMAATLKTMFEALWATAKSMKKK